jgi:hypothetical protein
MELKWVLAIVLEAGFWIMLAAFLVLRYRYGMESITRLFVVGVVLDTLGILALGVWDFAAAGEVSLYTVFIAALLAYALTLGKKDLRRLDAWMARNVRPRRATGRAGAGVPGAEVTESSGARSPLRAVRAPAAGPSGSGRAG